MLKLVLSVVALLGWLSVFALLWLALFGVLSIDEVFETAIMVSGGAAGAATLLIFLWSKDGDK